MEEGIATAPLKARVPAFGGNPNKPMFYLSEGGVLPEKSLEWSGKEKAGTYISAANVLSKGGT